MGEERQRQDSGTESPMLGVAAVGAAAFAVICCATAPLLAAAVSSLALGTVLGAGAGAIALQRSR